jgi:PHD/YefM family antitoxin component YafN of YafNO toxin-antitoxin module
MTYTLPISEARSNLPDIVKNAGDLFQKTYITVKGKIEAVVINPQELESLEATLEILKDPQTMKAIKKGQKEFKNNELIDWEDLKQELDL